MKIQSHSRPVNRRAIQKTASSTSAPSQTSSPDEVVLSRAIKQKAKGVGKGILTALASGAAAITGSLLGGPGIGFLAGTATSLALSSTIGVDQGDSLKESAQTGAFFGMVTSGFTLALGLPGLVASTAVNAFRWGIGN